MFPTPAQRDLAGFSAKLAAYGETPRYWRINRFEAFYNGQQYEGRPSFWNNDFPLRERAPVVQVGFTRAAVNRLATLVFGDRSFPRLTVDARVLRATLTDAEREALQALVDDVVRSLTLSHRMRQVITEGLKCSSACVVTGLVDGVPALEILPSKWCTPTLCRDGSVESLVVQWKHPVEGEARRWSWYRREITSTYDRVYDAVPFVEGRMPEWSGVPYTETPLTFCPVVWVRNLRPATASAADIDGCALVDGLEDEVEALDLELSQQFRNALYNGEPQMVQVGAAVPGDANTRNAAPSGFSWLDSHIGAASKWLVSGGPVTKKAPGKVWTLPQGGDAKILESSGAGAQIIKGAIDELRRVLCDATGVVLVDPQTLGNGDLSARALTLMHAPMLDVADNLRVEYGAVLVAVVNQSLRHLAAAGVGAVSMASFDAASSVMARMWGVTPDGARKWLGASITLAWGPYFEPSAQDRSQAVDTALKASGGGAVISRGTAAKSVASLFGVADVVAEVEAIEGETATEREAVTRTMRAIGGEPEPKAETVETEDAEVTIDAAPDAAVAPDPALVPDVPAGPKAADAALNGAQVSSMVDVVVKVAAGELPRDAAKAIIKRAFLVDDAGADEILGSAGTSAFKPAAAPSAAPPFGGG